MAGVLTSPAIGAGLTAVPRGCDCGWRADLRSHLWRVDMQSARRRGTSRYGGVVTGLEARPPSPSSEGRGIRKANDGC